MQGQEDPDAGKPLPEPVMRLWRAFWQEMGHAPPVIGGVTPEEQARQAAATAGLVPDAREHPARQQQAAAPRQQPRPRRQHRPGSGAGRRKR